MKLDAFLDDLARRGVELWTEDNRLRYRSLGHAVDAASLDRLKLHKDAIIELLTASGGSRRHHPLAYGQRSLWFLQQIAPETSAYNVAYPVRLCVRPDVPALTRSLNALAARHSALRTTFVERNGEPFQHIADRLQLALEEIDLRDCPRQTERIDAEYRRPFAMTGAPLWRAILFRQDEQHHVLLLVLHHLICDGWSLMSVLIDELGQMYQAAARAGGAALPALASAAPAAPAQYVDYVHWQRQLLEQTATDESKRYWVDKLGGELPTLDLPTDWPRPTVSGLRGASHGFAIERDLTARIRQVARQHNATLYMFLVAAFQTLLHRYTHQDDILIGSPTSGRSKSEFAGMVGHLVNSVVLRSRFDAGLTFSDLLQQVRGDVIGALDHQDYPFALLVENLQPERDLSRSPIFQAMLVTHKGEGRDDLFNLRDGQDARAISWGGMAAQPFAMAQQEGQFDLTLEVAETDDYLICILKYNSEIFAPERILAMAGHFETLIASICDAPGEPVALLAMLAADERQRLVDGWKHTAAPWLADRCVHQLFEASARAAPDAIALVCGEQALRYGELNERADLLCRRLQAIGVGPESLVGVFRNRDLGLIVALLAIMKAGGAYVPLDPAYPAERIGFMLDDAGARVIISDAALAPRLPQHHAAVICLDDGGLEDGADDAGAMGLHGSVQGAAMRAPTPANLAYVLFTSGSTGRPKGVQIEHRSVVAMLCWARDHFSPQELARVLASTSICFDLSVFEMFVPLSWGGTVVLAENALALPTLPARDSLTLINTVPSAIAELLRVGAIPPGVRTINLAGEPLKGSLVQDLYRNTRCERVLNLYGPSEDTTYSTWAQVRRGDLLAPTIGRPISNSHVYILSPQLQVVPAGVTGELFIGGAGLARGYLQQPELTAQKFIRHPFSDDPNARLYRTGDLARQLPNGELQFLGRIDNQVKVRGYRIELGEIEEILARFPGVQEVVATVKVDHCQVAKLVAYVAAEGGAGDVTAAALREHAKEHLPHFMVPTDFVVLDAMPHTPNGKIDRKALPEPRYDSDTATATGPTSAMETLVATVWSEVFERGPMSVQDNFFDIGGHSLMAAKVIFKLREMTGLAISIGTLFAHPTIAALAAAIDAIDGDKLEATDQAAHGDTDLNLAAEAALPPSMMPVAGGPVATLNTAKHVFLTGATGFVGSYLLMELLATTDATISCLVRADSGERAMARMEQAASQHGFANVASYGDRVRPVLGRLDKDCFGLSDAAFAALAHETDIVFHSAATINLTYPYRLLKPANVDGTREVIRLACSGKTKSLHYMSTISVFDAAAYFDSRVILESDDPTETGEMDHGYSQSKWVAERMVKIAAERGLPVCIHRLGSVVGSSRTGIWQSNDALHHLLSMALAMGEWMDFDVKMDWVPVDYVAQAVLAIARKKLHGCQTFHLVGRNATGSLAVFDWLSALDTPLKKVSAQQWHEHVTQGLMSRQGRDAGQVSLLLETILSVEQLEKLQRRQATRPRFDFADTAAWLDGSGLEVPAIDQALLLLFVQTPGNFTRLSGVAPDPGPDAGHAPITQHQPLNIINEYITTE